LARGATGTNIWMDVQVNAGAFPDNQPPMLQVEVLPTNAAPSELVHFHATASDPDGDTLAYAWTFVMGLSRPIISRGLIRAFPLVNMWSGAW